MQLTRTKGEKLRLLLNKALFLVVAMTHLVGQAIAFFGGIANSTGWGLVKFPCESVWTVLAFPLGWLGFIGGSFAAKQYLLPYFYLFLWAGISMNACLWSWIIYRVACASRAEGQTIGLDVSAISQRLSILWRRHVIIAQTRARPLYARKGLVDMASRVIRRCGFFAHQRISSEGELAAAETHRK